jgi:hypothetical protein
MLLTILFVLLALWFIGLVFHMAVGPIYILLVLGVVLGLVQRLSGRHAI